MLRRRRIRFTIGAVALGLLLLVGGLVLSRSHPVSARAATVPATIAINPGIRETFAPAPPSATPALTAQQAWQRYAEQAGSSHTTIPSSVTARLGLFTMDASPPGDPQTAGLPASDGKFYTPHNELSYGYSWHSCPPVLGAVKPHTQPPNPCRAWLFLDANTGHMIIQTWQR
jgi:hypothetical protein